MNKILHNLISIMMKMIIYWSLLVFGIIINSSLSSKVAAESNITDSTSITAMFAFGDSLTDPGNNNYLNSLAKANYVPYGVDFFQGPSGRFSNGRTSIDFLGDLLKLPLLPPYASPFATGKNLLKGVNYASAAAGILDESGQTLGERFSLRQQVENFENNLNQIRNELGNEEEMRRFLNKSISVLTLGSNDYINNYLLTTSYTTSYIYTPQAYADLLINHYARQIVALKSLGLRRFLLAGVGPLGCIPNQLANGNAQTGKCISSVNQMVQMFNDRLIALVDELNTNYSGEAIFVYSNTFGGFTDILNNSSTYGFTDLDSGCCGIGRKQGEITCLPFSVPCENRNQHVFWDAFHPTEAVHQILAQKAYYGTPSDCYPINIQQLAKLSLS